MMRETAGEVTHFSVISYWESRQAIRAYAGADEYEKYLGAAITKFTSIPGNLGYQKPRLPETSATRNLGYQMMRETAGEVTHFSVISYWESRQAIRAYAGADISKVRDLPRDREFLIEPEQTVRNYDLLVDARR